MCGGCIFGERLLLLKVSEVLITGDNTSRFSIRDTLHPLDVVLLSQRPMLDRQRALGDGLGGLFHSVAMFTGSFG